MREGVKASKMSIFNRFTVHVVCTISVKSDVQHTLWTLIYYYYLVFVHVVLLLRSIRFGLLLLLSENPLNHQISRAEYRYQFWFGEMSWQSPKIKMVQLWKFIFKLKSGCAGASHYTDTISDSSLTWDKLTMINVSQKSLDIYHTSSLTTPT